MEPRLHDRDLQVFELLFDHCSEAVFAVQRARGTIVAANRRLAQLTGVDEAGLIGAPVDRLFATRPHPTAARDEPYRVLEQIGTHEEVPLQGGDGQSVLVTLTVTHVEHVTAGPLAACLVRDTRERRALQRELGQKHLALFAAHAELERLVADLNDRNRELAERNRELALVGAELAAASRRALVGELSAGIAHGL